MIRKTYRKFAVIMLASVMMCSSVCAGQETGNIMQAADEGSPQQEPETPAPQPETPAPQPETPAPQPETPAPQPETPAPQTEPPAPQTEAPAQTETPAPQPETAASGTASGSDNSSATQNHSTAIPENPEEKKLKDWNVVLAGKKSSEEEKTVHFSNCSVVKVTRTRKATKNEIPEVINIGALRAPLDIIADVDLDGKSDEIKQLFVHVEENRVKEIRMKAGLGETPQLLLYIVDKDSKPAAGSKSRKDLNAPCDLFGICVNIPGGAIGTDHVAKVCIRLGNSFNDDGDLDGQNLEN